MPSRVVGGVAFQKGGAKLQAVRPVVGPRAGGLDELAGRDHGGVPGHGDEVALPAGLQTQDTEAVLLVVEGHALDEAGEVLGRRSGLQAYGRNVHRFSVARQALMG